MSVSQSRGPRKIEAEKRDGVSALTALTVRAKGVNAGYADTCPGPPETAQTAAAEPAIVAEVLDLLAEAIWADFMGRNRGDGQFPWGTEP